jgi:hypothetical protein
VSALARRRPAFEVELKEMAALILADYRRFVLGGEPDEGVAKAFGARHTAGRAALAHLEQVAKLAGIGGGAEEEAAARRISDSITAWRKHIPASPKQEPETDDDGCGA